MANKPKGRPSKLTPAVRVSVVDSIRVGLTKVLASHRAGIGASTLLNWIADGKRHRTMGKVPLRFDRASMDWIPRTSPKESIYAELAEAVEKAEADMITEAMAGIIRAAKGGAVVERTTKTVIVDGQPVTTVTEKVAAPDWRASAWQVERTRPADYGAHNRDKKVGDDLPAAVDGELVPGGGKPMEERVNALLERTVANAEQLGTADAALSALRGLESAAHAMKAVRDLNRKPAGDEFDESRLSDDELRQFTGMLEKMRVRKSLNG